MAKHHGQIRWCVFSLASGYSFKSLKHVRALENALLDANDTMFSTVRYSTQRHLSNVQAYLTDANTYLTPGCAFLACT